MADDDIKKDSTAIETRTPKPRPATTIDLPAEEVTSSAAGRSRAIRLPPNRFLRKPARATG